MQERRYCLWEPSEGAASVYLALDVVDALNAVIKEATATAPVRGAEIGGLLQGKMEQRSRTTVWIDRFELLPCRYTGGPSFRIEPEDLPDQMAADIVGYFRTHTRRDLFLSDDDWEMISQRFADPRQVFLLIKPFTTRHNLAGFFYWKDGGVDRAESAREFPFHRRELGGGDPIPVVPPPIPFAAQDREADWPPPEGGKPSRAPLLWVAAAIVTLGVAAPFAYWQYGKTHPKPVARRFVVPGFHLSATENERDITVKWDKGSLAVATATKAVLQIDEGPFHKTVDVEPDQLRNGSVLYSRPVAIADTIAFNLRVFSSLGEPVSESVKVVSNRQASPLAGHDRRPTREPAVTLGPPARRATPAMLPPPPPIVQAQRPVELPMKSIEVPKPEPPKVEPTEEAAPVARPAPRRAPK
jgi:hypothetical protein